MSIAIPRPVTNSRSAFDSVIIVCSITSTRLGFVTAAVFEFASVVNEGIGQGTFQSSALEFGLVARSIVLSLATAEWKQ